MTSAYRLADAPGVRVVVANLGLACCAMEVESAVRLGLLVPDVGSPPDRTVVLVSGTVTDVLVPALSAACDRFEGPVRVISFGSCASTGGPYWDSPTVAKGVGGLLPVSRYVPGCPPRPEALVSALLEDAEWGAA